jgi:hypothetical protein
VFVDPRFDVLSPPHLALDQLVVWRRPVRPLRELVDTLPADAAKPVPDLGRTHQNPGHVTTLQATRRRGRDFTHDIEQVYDELAAIGSNSLATGADDDDQGEAATDSTPRSRPRTDSAGRRAQNLQARGTSAYMLKGVRAGTGPAIRATSSMNEHHAIAERAASLPTAVSIAGMPLMP